MKTILSILAGVFAIVACSPSKDKAAQASLTNYHHFVDSIYMMNENYKLGTDTDYVETPTDPNDPSKTSIDTIVTLPSPNKSMMKRQYFSNPIKASYEPLKMEVESHLEKMDEKMKKEYEAAKEKFESMTKE